MICLGEQVINKITLNTFGNREKSLYEELGYDISMDKIEIEIFHLNSGSREIVPVQCDFCDDSLLTESQIMKNLEIYKIWDWGKMKFELNL